MLNYTENEHAIKHNFKRLAEKMLEERELSVSANTLEAYKHELKHLSVFFDYDIEDITPQMFQNQLDSLIRKGYGYWTIQKTKTVFGLVLSHAIKNGATISNYISEIKISKKLPKSQVHSPDDKIIDAITKNHDQPFGLWALMLLSTGFRRGELAALQKKGHRFQKQIYLSLAFSRIHTQSGTTQICPQNRQQRPHSPNP